MKLSPDRRQHFLRAIGERVEIRRAFLRRLPSDRGVLVEVNRTRAVIRFPDSPPRKVVTTDRWGIERVELVPDDWAIPLAGLLLPGCLESDPRQLPLFQEDAA